MFACVSINKTLVMYVFESLKTNTNVYSTTCFSQQSFVLNSTATFTKGSDAYFPSVTSAFSPAPHSFQLPIFAENQPLAVSQPRHGLPLWTRESLHGFKVTSSIGNTIKKSERKIKTQPSPTHKGAAHRFPQESNVSQGIVREN